MTDSAAWRWVYGSTRRSHPSAELIKEMVEMGHTEASIYKHLEAVTLTIGYGTTKKFATYVDWHFKGTEPIQETYETLLFL